MSVRMTTKKILKLIEEDPEGMRRALVDREVLRALDEIGVVETVFGGLKVRALHAPALGARTVVRKGSTLCDKQGIRHPSIVTCKRCLRRLRDREYAGT